NHGPERLGSFYPAARFRSSLYQPNLVRLILQEKNFDKALVLASQDRPEPIPALSVAQVLPPAVVITSPVGRDSAAKEGRIAVKARARRADHPITAMRLLVDGRPYLGDKGVKKFDPPAKGVVEASWTVDLLPGRHTLAAVAESSVSRGVSPSTEVIGG